MDAPARRHRRQARAARHVEEQHASRKQREATGAGHDQRLQRGRPRIVSLVFEADEQEGREAGQLPEDEQREDVVAERDAEHRAHEGEERRIEATRLRMTLQILARIQDDECADGGDEQREQQPQAVEVERE